MSRGAFIHHCIFFGMFDHNDVDRKKEALNTPDTNAGHKKELNRQKDEEFHKLVPKTDMSSRQTFLSRIGCLP